MALQIVTNWSIFHHIILYIYIHIKNIYLPTYAINDVADCYYISFFYFQFYLVEFLDFWGMKNPSVSSSNASYPWDTSSSKSQNYQARPVALMQNQKKKSIFNQFLRKISLIFSAFGSKSKRAAPEVDQGYANGNTNSNQIYSNSCESSLNSSFMLILSAFQSWLLWPKY